MVGELDDLKLLDQRMWHVSGARYGDLRILELKYGACKRDLTWMTLSLLSGVYAESRAFKERP